jgi:hypothetical protein
MIRAADDPVAYNRDIYARSSRERLRRINYSRRARGAPELASLSETKLRIPLSEKRDASS